MQIKPSQLQAHLQPLQALYVVQSDEPLLLQETVDQIRAAARAQGFSERTAYTASATGFDWAAVQGSVNSLSLFADQQLIEIFLPTGKPGKEGGQVLQKIAASLEPGAGTLVIVSLPKLDKKTKTSDWFAALEQHGVSVTLDTVERKDLPMWIAERLRLQGQHVVSGVEGEQTLRLFADRVEGNLLAAYQEVQKLGLLYPHGELSAEQIEASVTNVARYDVFKLSEAVLAGNAERTLRMLDGLRAEGVSEVQVSFTLGEDIRVLKRLRDAIDNGKPVGMALREQRVWGMREKLLERVIYRLTPIAANGLLHDAHVVDGIVKGIKVADWPADSWVALQRLASKLCTVAATPPKK